MDSNLNIDIKDYNGPLDVLLELVHKNKFDLKFWRKILMENFVVKLAKINLGDIFPCIFR